MVAITPRSFCNGPYFRPFRELLLSSTHLTHVHVFESRKSAFRGDDVLQENIVFRAVKGAPPGVTLIASSRAPDDDNVTMREVTPEQIVRPYCEFSKEADALTVYFKGDPDYSKRLTEHVTLYVSLENDELVGCRIKGISGIIDDLPNYIEVNHEDIKLSVIFLAFTGGSGEEHRKVFRQLAERAGHMPLTLCS